MRGDQKSEEIKCIICGKQVGADQVRECNRGHFMCCGYLEYHSSTHMGEVMDETSQNIICFQCLLDQYGDVIDASKEEGVTVVKDVIDDCIEAVRSSINLVDYSDATSKTNVDYWHVESPNSWDKLQQNWLSLNY